MAPRRTHSPRRTDSAAAALRLEHEASEDTDDVLRLQPERLRSEPILAFPVEGRGHSAIQSFFGPDRDAGRRVHHGIDMTDRVPQAKSWECAPTL